MPTPRIAANASCSGRAQPVGGGGEAGQPRARTSQRRQSSDGGSPAIHPAGAGVRVGAQAARVPQRVPQRSCHLRHEYDALSPTALTVRVRVLWYDARAP
jgi:hypothetical protein